MILLTQSGTPWLQDRAVGEKNDLGRNLESRVISELRVRAQKKSTWTPPPVTPRSVVFAESCKHSTPSSFGLIYLICLLLHFRSFDPVLVSCSGVHVTFATLSLSTSCDVSRRCGHGKCSRFGCPMCRACNQLVNAGTGCAPSTHCRIITSICLGVPFHPLRNRLFCPHKQHHISPKSSCLKKTKT